VASVAADGGLAGRAVVAVVALALERLVDAAAELAVGPLLADGAVRAAPAGITPLKTRAGICSAVERSLKINWKCMAELKVRVQYLILLLVHTYAAQRTYNKRDRRHFCCSIAVLFFREGGDKCISKDLVAYVVLVFLL
jgi:hypothetical protein